MARFATALLAGLALLVAFPASSWAKKRVVLFDFIGPQSGTFQSQVRAMLSRRAKVLPARTYNRTARRMGLTRSTPANARRVAARISADGMIGGVVRRLPGRRYRLTIRVRSGKTGRIVGAFSVTTRRTRLAGAAMRKVNTNLRASLRKLEPLVVEEGDDDDDGDGGRRKVARGDDDDDDGGSRRRRREPAKVEKRVDKKAEPDEPAVPLTDEEKADLLVRGRGLEIAGGLSVTSRTLAFTYTQGLANAPRGYKGSPVAGAYIAADLYPLALDLKNKGATRNIGVTFFVDKVIKINSQLLYDDPMTMTEMRADLPTEQLRWGVGAVYRHNFGNKPTSPTVKLSARYNRFTFDIDKTAAPMGVVVDIPNVDYTYYDVGLGVRYPVSPKLALNVEGRFMLMSDTGEVQQDDQYGGADVTGFDLDAGFEYRLNPRLRFRAGVRYLRIGFAFDGTGELAVNRDGDPNTVDVGGALDEYLGGYATLQYLF